MTIGCLPKRIKIKYDDPVSKYIPELSKYVNGTLSDIC